MINKKPDVLNALQTVKGVKDVFFYYPSDFKKLPCISYYEANNSTFNSADDAEYLSEINYVVDIWAEKSADASRIALDVNQVLQALGFKREFAADVYQEGAAAHKTMRFQHIGGS